MPQHIRPGSSVLPRHNVNSSHGRRPLRDIHLGSLTLPAIPVMDKSWAHSIWQVVCYCQLLIKPIVLKIRTPGGS